VPVPVVLGGWRQLPHRLAPDAPPARAGVLVGVRVPARPAPRAACLGIGVPAGDRDRRRRGPARSQHMLETGEYCKGDPPTAACGPVATSRKAIACGADAVMIGSPAGRAPYEAAGATASTGAWRTFPLLAPARRGGVATVQKRVDGRRSIKRSRRTRTDGTFKPDRRPADVDGHLRFIRTSPSFNRAELMIRARRCRPRASSCSATPAHRHGRARGGGVALVADLSSAAQGARVGGRGRPAPGGAGPRARGLAGRRGRRASTTAGQYSQLDRAPGPPSCGRGSRELLAAPTSASRRCGGGRPKGLILSGGAGLGVRGRGAAARSGAARAFGIPVLGICYGMQALVLTLGGQVEGAEVGEFRAASQLTVSEAWAAAGGGRRRSSRCLDVPPGHGVPRRRRASYRAGRASTESPVAALEDVEPRPLSGIQFPPRGGPHAPTGSRS